MGSYSIEQLLHLNCSVCKGWWTIGDGDPGHSYTCPHCCYHQSFSPALPIKQPAAKSDTGKEIATCHLAFCLGVFAVYGWLIPVKRPYSVAISVASVVALVLIYASVVIRAKKRI